MIIKRKNRNYTKIHKATLVRLFFNLHPWQIVWRDPFSCFSCHLQHCASSIFVFTFGQVFDLVAVRLQPASYLLAGLIKSAMHSSSLVAHKWPQTSLQEDQCVVCRNGWVSFECPPPHLTPLPRLFPKQTFLGGGEQIHKQVWSRTSIHALLRCTETCLPELSPRHRGAGKSCCACLDHWEYRLSVKCQERSCLFLKFKKKIIFF